MSVNKGKKAVPKTGKGHFAGAAQRLAKLRSGVLQHGVPKHSPTGASPIGGSRRPPNSGKMNTSKAQKALNPEQQ